MLVHWQSHQEYLYFLHEAKVHLDSSQRMRLHLEFGAARGKLRMPNLGPVMEYLSAFYSHTGRPAENQPQILRSLVLMMLLGVTSLTAWCQGPRADSLLAPLIGCRPDSLPPLGSYFGLMDRLWSQPKALQKTGRKDLFPKDKNSKPSNKPGKGKKLPNKHSGITEKLAAYALSHEDFPFHYEEHLQQLFRLAALIPSPRDGLAPADGVTLSGDGTCVHSHASPYGHKVCKCMENGIPHCSCKRHFSDPDAHWGWDSDEEVFYFGHTLYMLCSHNLDIGVDLPLHIRFLDSRRHDSVSVIVSPGNLRRLTRTSLSRISVWTPLMTTMPLMGFARNGISALLSTWTRTGAGRIPSRTPYPLTRMAPRCVWRACAWSTGATVNRSIPANGAALLPAAKRIPAPAKRNVPLPPMAGAFTQNRTGTSAFTLPLHAARMNIRRFTITALPAKE